MARSNDPIVEVEKLEEQIGLLLEKALDLAVSRPPQSVRNHRRHLVDIREAASSAVTLADAAIVLLQRRLDLS